MQKSYKNLAKYYDLLYQQKDYKSETDFILKIIHKYKIRKNSLLDVGCGTGTHLSLMQNEFKILYGIDLNSEILKAAKKKAPKAKFLNMGMADFKIKCKFNVITCLYSVFNYNLDIRSAIKTLKNFYRHLGNGGIVIIALYNERSKDKKISLHVGENHRVKVAGINQYKYFPKEKVVKSDYLLLIKDKGRVDFDIEMKDTLRIFSPKEINSMVKPAGFRKSYLFDGFSLAKANKGSKYPVLALFK